MPKLIDLTGQTFGRLTVIRRTSEDYISSSGNPYPQWECTCSCGSIKLITGSNLKNGSTQSCGCIRKDRFFYTHAELKAALTYVPETGEFFWNNSGKKKSPAGEIGRNGYMRIRFGRKHTYLAHRLAWFYVHGVWPKEEIDHINHIRTDNRIVNLREASRMVNAKNMSLRKDNTTGVMGVTKTKNGWRVCVNHAGKRVLYKRCNSFQKAVAIKKAAEVVYGFHDNHGS